MRRKISRARASMSVRVGPRVNSGGVTVCGRVGPWTVFLRSRISAARSGASCAPQTLPESYIAMRPSERTPDLLRPIVLETAVTRYAEGSCLISAGHTKVLVTASLEEGVPGFLRGKGQGWVTAEYGMLPRATHTRGRREAAGGKQSRRTQEIQRLIGRSLRAVVDMEKLGERQITLDCDVIQADGGTRTASISGAWVALRIAVDKIMAAGQLEVDPIRSKVAAVSCGVHAGSAV